MLLSSNLKLNRVRRLNLSAVTKMVALSFFRLRLIAYFLAQPLHDWSQRNMSPGDVLGMFWGCFGDAPKHPQNIPKTSTILGMSPKHPQNIPSFENRPQTIPMSRRGEQEFIQNLLSKHAATIPPPGSRSVLVLRLPPSCARLSQISSDLRCPPPLATPARARDGTSLARGPWRGRRGHGGPGRRPSRDKRSPRAPGRGRAHPTATRPRRRAQRT